MRMKQACWCRLDWEMVPLVSLGRSYTEHIHNHALHSGATEIAIATTANQDSGTSTAIIHLSGLFPGRLHCHILLSNYLSAITRMIS